MSDEVRDVLNGDWQVFRPYDEISGTVVQFMDLGTHLAFRTIYLHTPELLDLNAARRMDEHNKGWSDGKVVASIPLNVMFDTFGEAMKDGDQKWIAKQLNDGDFSKFRTKEGKL